MNLVNKEYMIWQEMYGNGRWNIPLVQTFLVPFEGAILTSLAAIIQQFAVVTTIQSVTTASLGLGFRFFKVALLT